MMILNPDADQEAQAELTARVRTLVEETGGTVTDVAEWGRRPIAYPVRKHADGVYIIVTCEASAAAIDEVTEPWPRHALDPETYRDAIEKRFKAVVGGSVGITGAGSVSLGPEL